LNEPITLDDLNSLKISLLHIKDFNDDYNNIIFGNIQNNHHRYDRSSLTGVDAETIEISLE
jgi:hypothetical protein